MMPTVFGLLTPTGTIERRQRGIIYDQCRCACGTVCFRARFQLARGKSTHCGCRTKRTSDELTQENINRFLLYVSPEPNTGCWLWTSGCKADGYGTFTLASRKSRIAHRLAYRMFRGEIPEGMHIDHLCRVRCCVNPDHLEIVTPRENMLRGLHGVLRTSCLHGHPLTPENTYVLRNRKFCRTCSREGNRARKRIKIAAFREAHLCIDCPKSNPLPATAGTRRCDAHRAAMTLMQRRWAARKATA